MVKGSIAFLLCSLATAHSLPVDIAPNVIGSFEVDSIERFPYQTVIYARRDSGTSISSGSILSAKYVMTCAHCLINSRNASVYYGSAKLSALDNEKSQVVGSENYRVHPSYSPFVNDIALILMNENIAFSG